MLLKRCLPFACEAQARQSDTKVLRMVRPRKTIKRITSGSDQTRKQFLLMANRGSRTNNYVMQSFLQASLYTFSERSGKKAIDIRSGFGQPTSSVGPCVTERLQEGVP